MIADVLSSLFPHTIMFTENYGISTFYNHKICMTWVRCGWTSYAIKYLSRWTGEEILCVYRTIIFPEKLIAYPSGKNQLILEKDNQTKNGYHHTGIL